METSGALLADSTGVLHLRAHTGTEAAEYSGTGLSVIWVAATLEPSGNWDETFQSSPIKSP